MLEIKNLHVELEEEGKQILKGKTPGSITDMPVDGLQVGADKNGAVGEYHAPFAYGGKVTAKIQIGK